MHKNLESVHKGIYNYLKKKALNYEGKSSALLEQYRKDQHKSANRKFQNSNIRQLDNAIEAADIIYLGDFHTFDQSTRNLERLIRLLTTKRHQFAIGLEFVDTKYQCYINYYLSGHITELEFLESINYKESWRFPWTFYKQFFHIARKLSISIIALNTKGSLKKRDQHAAKIIKHYNEENPDHKLLILFGEYHIVKDKLPEKVKKVISTKVKQVIIHQNLDEVYWKLFKKNPQLKDKIVKFNNQEYVLITSAPWLKYESQIYWYEHMSEDPDFDIHEYIIETGALNFSENVPDNFVFICDEIIKTFKLDVDSRLIEDFHLHDHIQLGKIKKLIDKLPKNNLKGFYIDMIKRGLSFKVNGTKTYFCSSYSINRISYLSGIHLHNILLMGKNKKTHKEVLIGSNREAIFVYFVFQCMSGYLASKLINPYRKCDMYKDLKQESISKINATHKRSNIKRSLKLLNKRASIKETIKGLKLLTIYMMARSIGHIFADILFDNYFVKKKTSFKEALEIIYNDDFSKEAFNDIYRIVTQNIKISETKKRVF
jgi:uncharacterized iron-regulated protein